MSENKTKPTTVSVESFLGTLSQQRAEEARVLLPIMQEISGDEPKMWGPSIIGFGSVHYTYDTGREGDMPRLGFSPRKAQLTIYFEGFDAYGEQLARLGPHSLGVSCLYIKKLELINLDVLRDMLEQSFRRARDATHAPTSVDEYIRSLPVASRNQFDELRKVVKGVLPHAEEVLSYGIIGYKIDEKRPRVFISGWRDHVAMYPIPKTTTLKNALKPYVKSKGTLWFALGEPLPRNLIREVVTELTA